MSPVVKGRTETSRFPQPSSHALSKQISSRGSRPLLLQLPLPSFFTQALSVPISAILIHEDLFWIFNLFSLISSVFVCCDTPLKIPRPPYSEKMAEVHKPVDVVAQEAKEEVTVPVIAPVETPVETTDKPAEEVKPAETTEEVEAPKAEEVKEEEVKPVEEGHLGHKAQGAGFPK